VEGASCAGCFGLTAGAARVRATFWLLDAPDSLEIQGHRNVDGSGIGFFDSAGVPVLDKEPEPASKDEAFIHAAKEDSERYFALITQQIDAHGGDVGAGIAAAARWIAANLPVSALNTVVAAPGELWALRYPGQHALHMIERPAGPGDSAAAAGLRVRSSTSSVHVPALQSAPSVVIASERLDGERGWRMLANGELVPLRPDLSVRSPVVITDPPARSLPIPSQNPNIDT
jgi:predicted glutamine amidotransferase